VRFRGTAEAVPLEAAMKVRLSNSHGTIEVEGTQDEVATVVKKLGGHVLDFPSETLNLDFQPLEPWCEKCRSRHQPAEEHRS
jgi:hypothetical protein